MSHYKSCFTTVVSVEMNRGDPRRHLPLSLISFALLYVIPIACFFSFWYFIYRTVRKIHVWSIVEYKMLICLTILINALLRNLYLLIITFFKKKCPFSIGIFIIVEKVNTENTDKQSYQLYVIRWKPGEISYPFNINL